MNFFDVTTLAVGVSSLTCFVAKTVCLIWAFVRVKKPAALVYLVFLVVNGLLPLVLAYTVSPESYASIWLAVGVGGALLETGLFIWLVWSFVPQPSNPVNLPQDAS